MYVLYVILVLCLISDGKALELDSFYKYLSRESNSSSNECDIQKRAFLRGLLKKEQWALRSKFVNYVCY